MLGLEYDDNATSVWAVSPALRHMLVETGNLRHAEAILTNRKCFTVSEVGEMNEKDKEAFCAAVVDLWEKYGWNTANVPRNIDALLQKCTNRPLRPGRITKDTICRAPVTPVTGATPSAIVQTMFPQFFQTMTEAQRHLRNTSASSMPDMAVCFALDHQSNRVPVDVARALEEVAPHFQVERTRRIINSLQLSEISAAESAAFAALALAEADEVPVPPPPPGVEPEDSPRKVVKRAKLAIRNCLLLRIVGWAQGIETQGTVDDRCPAVKDAAQTRAQLVNGFRKLRDAWAKLLAGAEFANPIGAAKKKRPKAKGKAGSSSVPSLEVHEDNQEEERREAEESDQLFAELWSAAIVDSDFEPVLRRNRRPFPAPGLADPIRVNSSRDSSDAGRGPSHVRM